MNFWYNAAMGTLYIVATPIGNLEDITIRAARILYTAHVLLCEDTRQTGMLIDLLEKRFPFLIPPGAKHPKLLRYDNTVERTLMPELIERLINGENMTLVSDAGTPLISDPGYVLVSEARKRNITVVSIPGASAVLTALTSSGFPADTFTFLGYPPEKEGHRQALLRNIVSMNQFVHSTYIMYSAPHKLDSLLKDMQEVMGNIDIVICRELTKVHEEHWRGPIADALAHFKDPKGEIVLVFGIQSPHAAGHRGNTGR